MQGIELDGFPGQPARHGIAHRVSLMQLHRGQFVLAAGLQSRIDAAKPLAAQKTEQHARLFRAYQQHGTIGEINQMAPADDFDEILSRRLHRTPQVCNEIPLPTGQPLYIGIGTCRGNLLLQGPLSR
jgi:hypothetical protein